MRFVHNFAVIAIPRMFHTALRRLTSPIKESGDIFMDNPRRTTACCLRRRALSEAFRVIAIVRELTAIVAGFSGVVSGASGNESLFLREFLLMRPYGWMGACIKKRRSCCGGMNDEMDLLLLE